ncbi:MAG: hypothetical protein KJ600_06445 [Nanoarchaeota archaeon]|nr:hypothetical protein [Nanoarchaeota archaeon]MBU1104164.1 hypothetical protein [Nanoarchaeota archaeon]
MNYKFIKSSEKRKILAGLEEQYGITDLPYLLIETGKKRLRAFSGSLSKEEISDLAQLTNIELIGMYLISRKDNDLRLNFDAISLLRNQITKNIVGINKDQFELWIRGHDLEIETQRGIVIISFENELVGIGKSNAEKIFNYLPKERRIKTALPADSQFRTNKTHEDL